MSWSSPFQYSHLDLETSSNLYRPGVSSVAQQNLLVVKCCYRVFGAGDVFHANKRAREAILVVQRVTFFPRALATHLEHFQDRPEFLERLPEQCFGRLRYDSFWIDLGLNLSMDFQHLSVGNQMKTDKKILNFSWYLLRDTADEQLYAAFSSFDVRTTIVSVAAIIPSLPAAGPSSRVPTTAPHFFSISTS